MYAEACMIAEKLFSKLSTPESRKRFREAQALGSHSVKVQHVVWQSARELGFASEKKGLFSKYETSALRPDMYKPLSTSGILLEVERGKTLKNNMDLLDLWKTHICTSAHYLFLFVPHFNARSGGRESVYPAVVKRLRSFYDENNLTNVHATFIFGY